MKYSRKKRERTFCGLGKAARGGETGAVEGWRERGGHRGRELSFQVGGKVGDLGILSTGVRTVVDGFFFRRVTSGNEHDDTGWSGLKERSLWLGRPYWKFARLKLMRNGLGLCSSLCLTLINHRFGEINESL